MPIHAEQELKAIYLKRSANESPLSCTSVLVDNYIILRDIVLDSSVYQAIVNDGYSSEKVEEIWNALKLYLRAHRSLVPFVNNDPDLYCSLPIGVSGRKVRWLVGDGIAKILTALYVTQETQVNMTYKHTSFPGGSQALLVSGTTWNAQNTTWGVYINTSTLHYFNGGTTSEFYVTLQTNIIYNIVMYANQNYCYINGTQVSGKTAFPGVQTDSPIVHKMTGNTKEVIISRSDINVGYFVPCKNLNGSDYGMLDLVSATWYGNSSSSGTFSVEKTS